MKFVFEWEKDIRNSNYEEHKRFIAGTMSYYMIEKDLSKYADGEYFINTVIGEKSFSTLSKAKEFVDEDLKGRGYKFITREQYKKLQILL
jgi:hypothetical protein